MAILKRFTILRLTYPSEEVVHLKKRKLEKSTHFVRKGTSLGNEKNSWIVRARKRKSYPYIPLHRANFFGQTRKVQVFLETKLIALERRLSETEKNLISSL